MKTVLTLIVVATIGGFAFGQTPAPEKPPLPAGPIVSKVPESAVWKITFTAPKRSEKKEQNTSDTAGPAEIDSGGQQKPQQPKSIVVVKTGDVVKVTETEVGGRSQVRWYYSGREFNAQAAGRWSISSGSGQVPGFSDFKWVSAKNYTDVASISGQRCYIFQDNIRLPEYDEPVPVTAGISIETQLPVYLILAGEPSVYTFGPPPAAPLQVPEGILSVMAAEKKLGEELMRRPH